MSIPGHGRALTDGSAVTVEIEGIGRLVDTCRFERIAMADA